MSTDYIDYETFLSPTFSPTTFANTLILSTNNAFDSTLDLSTPLSRTLFDLQEVDTHIHSVTTSSALPLLSHTATQTSAASRVLSELGSHVRDLSASYGRLENEVIARHAGAEEVRLAASRLWVTIKIGRAAQRALQLGRQLELQMADVRPNLNAPRSRDDHRSMRNAAGTILTLKALFAADGQGEEGEHLGRIAVVSTLRRELVEGSEVRLKGRAQQVVREFSLASVPATTTGQGQGGRDDSPARGAITSPNPATVAPSTYAQTAETKARTTSALITLYLLSPVSTGNSQRGFTPTLLLTALQTYLHTSLTSSAASLSRALAQLPTLPKALQEVMARCKNVVALERLLEGIERPDHPLVDVKTTNAESNGTNGVGGGEGRANENGVADYDDDDDGEDGPKENLLTPLLTALDTSSLPSFFWRSLASGMGSKVGDILNRGGAPARTLRTQRDSVRERVREAVLRSCEGARVPEGRGGDNAWEREAAVMVASVVGPLSR